MTRSQDVFLAVIALAFACWGLDRFSRIAAAVVAIVAAVVILLFALFGD